jgi:hypothetical protein
MKKETKQYKLMRMCDGKMGWGTDWEIQITGSMDECKDTLDYRLTSCDAFLQ